MQVGVLGPLLVRVDEHDVPLRGQRLRDVLVVLLQRRGRPVPAELVLDLVWGDAAAGLTTSAVHTVVARLRRQLGSTAITSDGIGYVLDRRVATDEDTFTDLLARARACAGRNDQPGACRNYRAALGGWRGPQAFADAAAELVEADRYRLAELRAVTAEELAAALLHISEDGGLEEAQALTTDLIATHPLRERPYQLGMLAAYRSHRQADALAIYQDLCRRLRVGLGIEPTPTSAQLNSRILRQDPALDARRPAVTVPAGSADRPLIAGLPAPVTPLIARSTELNQLLEALARGFRLITLVGPGGVGKSRLLIELGARRQEVKGVLYTEMSGLTEVGPDELAGTIAAGHGASDSRRPPVEALVAALADGNWLLLIDEAEWVVDSIAPVVTAILAGCPGVQIVLTSRIPMDLAGEFLVAIDPLGVPDAAADIATIFTAPAVQFLAERLADRAVYVGRDEETAELLVSITRRVDGLPLAMELACGQSAGRSLAEIAEQVPSMLDIPAARGSRSDRHRTMRNALGWSMSRLTADQRTVLRRLSLLAGRFTVTDAVAICGPVADVADIVRSLARESLIHVERTGASRLRFRLLRAVRDLAAEGFDGADLATTQALHRRWFAAKARADGADLVIAVGDSYDDSIEALHSALAGRDASTLADLAVTMAEFWRYTGGQVVGIKWIGRVLDTDVLGPRDRARVQAHRAALALHHFPELVLPDAEAALPVLAADPEDPLLVLVGSVRAVELLSRGYWAQAIEQADGAVRYARPGAPEALVKALSVQANVHAVSGDRPGATQAIAEVRSLIDDSTSAATRTIALTNTALAMLNLDRPADALQMINLVPPDGAIRTGRRPPDFLLVCRGWAELGCGDLSAALHSFSAGLPIHVPGIADRQSAETYLGVGCTLAELSHPSAAGILAAALELTERVQLTMPPAMDRGVRRAAELLGLDGRTGLGTEPTEGLVEGLQRTLADVVNGKV